MYNLTIACEGKCGGYVRAEGLKQLSSPEPILCDNCKKQVAAIQSGKLGVNMELR